MAIAHVASTSFTNGASSGTSPAINTTGANLLIAVLADYYGGGSNVLSDSKGNTWTLIDSYTGTGGGGAGGGTCRLKVYYCLGGTVGTGHTVTATGSGNYGSVAFAAYSGVAASAPLDQHTIGGINAVTSVQAGSVTPSEAGEIVIGALCYQTAAAVASINGGFTKRVNDNPQSGVSFGVAIADLVQTSAAAANPTWSWTGSGDAAAAIATFKAAGGGDTTAPVLSSPTGAATGPTTATVGATTDEGNGTLYGVVTTSATQPSVAQIKAGQDHTGAAAVWGGSGAVSATGARTLNATGLAASTTYRAHLVHSDAAGNDSNRVTAAAFTTPAIPYFDLTLANRDFSTNNGTPIPSEALTFWAYNPSTGALVATITGLSTNASAIVTAPVAHASLAASTTYRLVWKFASGKIGVAELATEA